MRNKLGQFIKGSKKTRGWYEAMEKRTGENHSMWKGGPKTEIIECGCGCGQKLNKYDKKNRARKLIQGHQHAKPWLGKIRNEMMGKNNWNWSGGIMDENHKQRLLFRRKIQSRVFERDNYVCKICGSGGDLQVDHIKSWAKHPEMRFEMDNCRTLCVKCHYRITFNRAMPKHTKSWGHNLVKEDI